MKRVGLALFLMLLALFILPIMLLDIKHNQKGSQQLKFDDTYTIKVFRTDTGKIQEMGFEEYILGVVAGEMPVSFNIEALKAQTLAARTYTLLRLPQFGGKGCTKYPGADICTDPAHCQAYRDPKTIKKDLNKLKSAVLDTKGEIIIYGDALIDAVFHSTSGGKTENSEDVWSNKIPYLRSVISPYEDHSPKFVTQKEIAINDFIKEMKELDKDIKLSKSKIKSQIKVLERSEGGKVLQIQIGGKTFEGTAVRAKLGLNSSNFNFKVSQDTIIFTVTGYGHGIGLSQYGADGMADHGAGYAEILKHYYQGVDIVKMEDFEMRSGRTVMNQKN